MRYQVDFSSLASYSPVFLTGAWLTLKMTSLAVLLGLCVGVLVAFARRSPHRGVAKLCRVYVEAVRNTPFLVQIFLLYFGLASFGIHLPTFAAAILAMVVNIGAYSAEIIRAGLDAV